MVDIMDKMQKISEIGMSAKDKQGRIDVSDAVYAWNIMVAKLDIMENVHIIENFIDDIDLRYIANQVIDALKRGIADMEQIMTSYGVPFPIRPPANNKTAMTMEYFTVRYIYQNLHEAIQAFFPVLAQGYMQSTKPFAKKRFKNHVYTTMELHEQIIEYGKLKGFLDEPPVYNA